VLLHISMKKFCLVFIGVGAIILIGLLLFPKSEIDIIWKDYEEIDIIPPDNIFKSLNIPENIIDIIKLNSKYYGIDHKLLLAIISVESDFNTKANSYLGAKYGRGLMQVSEIALKDYNRVNKSNIHYNDLYDPYINVSVGCWVFNQNTKYGVPNNLMDLVLAYNVGSSAWKTTSKEDSYYLYKILKKLDEFD